MKTMYKDPLYIPSRPLALALAEEWDKQLATIDMRSMYLNTMIAKAVRTKYDDGSLVKYMNKEIIKVINND